MLILTVALEPIRTTLVIDQINIVLLALVTWDLLRTKQSRWTGVGIGIAAGIKLTPLIFIPYLLLTKRFRRPLAASISQRNASKHGGNQQAIDYHAVSKIVLEQPRDQQVPQR